MGNASGAAPHSLARHAATLAGAPKDNPERATLNQFLLAIGDVKSVPVKAASQIARILPTLPHPRPRQVSERTCLPLIASAVAHGLTLEPGVMILRAFLWRGVQGGIENGVARDILKRGLAELVAAPTAVDERFRMSPAQIAMMAQTVGTDRLASRGLL